VESDLWWPARWEGESLIILGTGHPAIICSTQIFCAEKEWGRVLWILSCLTLVEGLQDFYGIISPYIWRKYPIFTPLTDFSEVYHPTSPIQRKHPIFTPLNDLLHNYTTLHQLFKKISNFYPLTDLLSNYTTLSKGSIQILPLSWFIKQLHHPTSAIQRKYPIFTPLTDFLSN
jgi:hypothetical protein